MIERLSDKNPCDSCKVDRQIGNPNRWECECSRCDKPNDWKNDCIKKLAEYENAEEEGRLKVLPCEVGTRVYEIYQFCGCGAWEIEEHKIKLEDLDKIGKTVFLTREEAEKALKEMEGNQSE